MVQYISAASPARRNAPAQCLPRPSMSLHWSNAMLAREEILSNSESSEYRMADRFLLSATGCLEYTGAPDKCGYGRFSVGDRRIGAHRACYAMTFGECDPSMVLMHSCDNPKCVNPSHMTMVDQYDNIRDSVTKGRHRQNGIHKDALPYKTTSRGRPLIGCKGNEILIFRRWHDAAREGFRCGPLMRAARGAKGRMYKGYEWRYADRE